MESELLIPLLRPGLHFSLPAGLLCSLFRRHLQLDPVLPSGPSATLPQACPRFSGSSFSGINTSSPSTNSTALPVKYLESTSLLTSLPLTLIYVIMPKEITSFFVSQIPFVSSKIHPPHSNHTDPFVHAKLLQSCPTLCNLVDCSPPGSSDLEILQARTLKCRVDV